MPIKIDWMIVDMTYVLNIVTEFVAQNTNSLTTLNYSDSFDKKIKMSNQDEKSDFILIYRCMNVI